MRGREWRREGNTKGGGRGIQKEEGRGREKEQKGEDGK